MAVPKLGISRYVRLRAMALLVQVFKRKNQFSRFKIVSGQLTRLLCFNNVPLKLPTYVILPCQIFPVSLQSWGILLCLSIRTNIGSFRCRLLQRLGGVLFDTDVNRTFTYVQFIFTCNFSKHLKVVSEYNFSRSISLCFKTTHTPSTNEIWLIWKESFICYWIFHFRWFLKQLMPTSLQTDRHSWLIFLSHL